MMESPWVRLYSSSEKWEVDKLARSIFGPQLFGKTGVGKVRARAGTNALVLFTAMAKYQQRLVL